MSISSQKSDRAVYQTTIHASARNSIPLCSRSTSQGIRIAHPRVPAAIRKTVRATKRQRITRIRKVWWTWITAWRSWPYSRRRIWRSIIGLGGSIFRSKGINDHSSNSLVVIIYTCRTQRRRCTWSLGPIASICQWLPSSSPCWKWRLRRF